MRLTSYLQVSTSDMDGLASGRDDQLLMSDSDTVFSADLHFDLTKGLLGGAFLSEQTARVFNSEHSYVLTDIHDQHTWEQATNGN